MYLFRTTNEHDAFALRTLRLESLRLYPTSFTADLAADEARSPTQWSEMAREGAGGNLGVLYVAATEPSTLVAMAGLHCQLQSEKTGHLAHLWGVYVQPAWQRKGIADTLIQQCLQWATDHDVRVVTLSVAAINPSAISCYLRHGFTVGGVMPEAIQVAGKFYDELVMTKRLAARI